MEVLIVGILSTSYIMVVHQYNQNNAYYVVNYGHFQGKLWLTTSLPSFSQNNNAYFKLQYGQNN